MKMLLTLLLMVTMALATNLGDNKPQCKQGPVGPQGKQGPVGPQGIQGVAGVNGTNGIDGTNGTNGPNGVDGVDGTNGVDGITTVVTQTNYNKDDFNKLRGALSAVSSVDFNPDHQGWSVGLGVAQASSTSAGAIGIQYGFDGSLGVNVKAYDAEGGNNGMSIGITKGF
jgi:hypothetical protein